MLIIVLRSDYFHQELYDTVEQLSKERIEGLMKASALTVCGYILTALFNYSYQVSFQPMP